MNPPSLDSLILWGIPLLGLVDAIEALIKWAWPGYIEKVVKLVGGVLLAVGAFFVMTLDHWLGLYPDLAMWGPVVLWTLVMFLARLGFYGVSLVARKVRRMLVD